MWNVRPSVTVILSLSLLLRIAFFSYGLYQDAHMKLPYTDIDYYVFTDAARYLANESSPFLRATYRYSPLLAYILKPTALAFSPLAFSYGKFIFILCDLITGYFVINALPSYSKLLSVIWLWNPFVITISTRGSAESLITCFVLYSSYLLTKNHYALSGALLGFAIHLKIYPLIYVSTYLLFAGGFRRRLFLLLGVLLGFVIPTILSAYSYDGYLHEALFYHFIRLDHRHNFSIYNTLLYLHSSLENGVSAFGTFTLSDLQHLDLAQLGAHQIYPVLSFLVKQVLSLKFETLAFIPQLGLSAMLVPFNLRGGFTSQIPESTRYLNLYKIMFIQTFVFVTFNKVCTSQYFIWYICFLPQYISGSTITISAGLRLLAGWVLTQAVWLAAAYQLEFNGNNTFLYLFFASCLFFVWNVRIICSFIYDVRKQYDRACIQSKETIGDKKHI